MKYILLTPVDFLGSAGLGIYPRIYNTVSTYEIAFLVFLVA
jgi:hypothetical protein